MGHASEDDGTDRRQIADGRVGDASERFVHNTGGHAWHH
ncbi:hypothetical protein SNL152K_3791 [Streptomyces sp. NL15-2K]|nr:hypothetical protein SNL152K_3791 [Streptomyces sp. NL15-2K]